MSLGYGTYVNELQIFDFLFITIISVIYESFVGEHF